MANFDTHWIPEPNSGCWLWMGAHNPAGYGIIRRNERNVKAHRFSYEMAKGVIPDGHEIDHLCCNKACVNPDHLEAVTGAENRRRGARFRSKNAVEFQCVQCGCAVERVNMPSGDVRCKDCIHLNAARKYDARNVGRKNQYYQANRQRLLESAKKRYYSQKETE